MHLPFYLTVSCLRKGPRLVYKVQAQKTETWEERQSSLREERKAAQFIKRWCKWSVWRFFYLSVSFFFPFFLSFSNTLKNWNNFDKMNVYVPCRVSVRDQGELVANVLHVLGQRIVDSVTSARYCVTKQNLLQDEASPWENFYFNSVKHSCLISPPGLLQSLGKEEISF